jgi:tetratricopeptide (TPR) repeat protein
VTSSAFLLAGPLFGLALVQGALASGFVGLLAGAGCWLYLRPGWRRQRVLRRAGQHLRSGQWQKALDLVREQQKRPCPPSWQGRLRRVEEDCLHRAASISLGAKRYEEALDHLHQASELQGVNPDGSLKRIQGAMLQEIYRLYALQTTERVESALALCARLLAIDSSCAEAHFWQGLCRLFHGKNDEALKSLRSANELSGDGYLDPAFYLGGLLRRNGQPVEAVRHLALAQRLAPKSGFVSLELGRALMEASGEISLAVRAFERAIESLTATIANGIPGDRAWCEPMPAAHSFVHSRTGLDPFVCPLMGSDIKVLVREAKLALAGVLARARSLPDAIALYRSLLAEAPPTPPVLRGLGQALARQGNYEEAYAQLRLGSENEATADPLTNGYMALCAAKGKPPQSEDRAANVSWALRLLASIDARGNAELTGLWSAVHAEARSLGLKIPQEEQVRLCDYLASVEAIEAQAASGYRHLAASYPENLSPLHCWFYCRAVLTSKGTIENDLRLYALAFGDAEKMRAFYAEHGWDCDEVETHYLERAAAFEPGVFPAVLGRDYETRGEQLLLERSRRLESSGLEGPALASAEALLKLAPTNCSAHDRLAELCYRQGDLKRAATLLTNYHRLAPADPLPLVRRAIIEQQLGENDASSLSLSAALEIAPKSNRAGISFIGARLALTELVQHSESGQPDVDEAQVWLDSCLQEEPGHQQALWCRAALLALRGDSSALAELSATLKDDSADGRFQIMAALCALAANDYPGAKESAHRASEKDPGLALEAAYLVARAELALGNREAAGVMLEKAAASPQGNILDQVRALLGSLAFQDKNYAAAISRWERIDPEHRASWKLDEPLRSTALVAGLQDLTAGRFQQAAQRFREAGRLGSHERQLGALLILALIQEGHRLSHLDDPDQRSGGPRLLEQALKAGCRDDNVGYSLALAHKRSGQYRDARKVLERISKPDADDLLQMAVLSLADGRLAQAEQDLERARSLAPDSPELCHNLLFTRLSLRPQAKRKASLKACVPF